MKILKTLMIIPLAGMLAMPVYAHQYDNDGYQRFDKRMENQKSRIRQGVKSGELTKQEAKKLRNQQKKIATTARKFRSDGRLDRHERQKLEKKQDKAHKKIFKLKHNDRDRDIYRGSHSKHNHGHHYGWKHRNRHDYRPDHRHHYKRHYYGSDDGYTIGGRFFDDGGSSLFFRLTDYY